MISKKSKKLKPEKEPEDLKNTIQIRLYLTVAQAKMLREHCQEYIDCVNVIVQAHDADMIPKGFSTKDFTAPLPRCRQEPSDSRCGVSLQQII